MSRFVGAKANGAPWSWTWGGLFGCCEQTSTTEEEEMIITPEGPIGNVATEATGAQSCQKAPESDTLQSFAMEFEEHMEMILKELDWMREERSRTHRGHTKWMLQKFSHPVHPPTAMVDVYLIKVHDCFGFLRYMLEFNGVACDFARLPRGGTRLPQGGIEAHLMRELEEPIERVYLGHASIKKLLDVVWTLGKDKTWTRWRIGSGQDFVRELAQAAGLEIEETLF